MNRAINRQENLNESNDIDIELINCFCKGDKSAFNRLVLKYQDLVMNLCVRYLGNRSDGEDAAQETFVKIYKNLSKFKGDALFYTWLYRIALNTCKNHKRSWWSRLKKNVLRLDVPIKNDDTEFTPEIGDEKLSPIKDFERIQIADSIRNALKNLSQKHRELIIMRDIQSLSYEEISAISGITLGTIKSRLVRARSAMRQQLRGIIDER